MKYILDTHILLWWLTDDKRLSKRAFRAIERSYEEPPLGLCEISLWEIAMLVNLGRISLDRPLRDWLELATAPPLVSCQRLTPVIAAEVASLPQSFHRDSADRIIVATTRVLGSQLVTADSGIQDANIVQTVF